MFQNSQRFLFPFSPEHPGLFLTPSPAHHMTCRTKRPGWPGLALTSPGLLCAHRYWGLEECSEHAELKANTYGAVYQGVYRELLFDAGTICDGWVRKTSTFQKGRCTWVAKSTELSTRLLARGFTWSHEERVAGLASTCPPRI